MKNIEQLTNTKYLNLKKIIDPENGVNGYYFAERLGVDSIAFVCRDIKTGQILLNNEFKPPIRQKILGSFGGSRDKDKSLVLIVKDEVAEEAGFEVETEDIKYLGVVFVSTQMNQFCSLFMVSVNKNEQKERRPESKIEEMAETRWVDESDYFGLTDLLDWKVTTIMAKWNARKDKLKAR